MTELHDQMNGSLRPRTTARPEASGVGGVRAAAMLSLAVVLSVAMATAGLIVPVADVGTYVVDRGTALPAGAEVLDTLPLVDALVVSSPVAISGSAPLSAPAEPESLLMGTAPGGETLDSAVASTGAPQAWGVTRGDRAVVALIDTGVAPVPAVDGAMAGEIDFSGTGGGDGYGHGTFMASLIAGRGTVAPGVAPEAGILSLKVAGPDGSATLGSVLTALHWLHGPGRSAGIRVAVLPLAVEPGTRAADFLDRGVRRLARAGVLVVTASGNDGPGNLTSPATALGAVSVGAVDDAATADRADDVVADFSGTGVDATGAAQPDLVASGVDVTGSLPPDSVLAASATPQQDGLYTGTGTSMSTAVTAGVAALASSARPDLDGTALAAALAVGGGQVDAPATVEAALAAPEDGRDRGNGRGHGRGHGRGNGHGNEWNDRGHDRGDDRGHGRGHGRGNGRGAPSLRWSVEDWTSIRWTGSGWGDGAWDMHSWGSIRWTGRDWAYSGPEPQSIRWTSIRWTSIRWTAPDR